MMRDKIRLLVATGEIKSCTLHLQGGTWYVSLLPSQLQIAEGNGAITLDAARGGPRRFRSLDAAAEAVRDLGLRTCTVHLVNMLL